MAAQSQVVLSCSPLVELIQSYHTVYQYSSFLGRNLLDPRENPLCWPSCAELAFSKEFCQKDNKLYTNAYVRKGYRSDHMLRRFPRPADERSFYSVRATNRLFYRVSNEVHLQEYHLERITSMREVSTQGSPYCMWLSKSPYSDDTMNLSPVDNRFEDTFSCDMVVGGFLWTDTENEAEILEAIKSMVESHHILYAFPVEMSNHKMMFKRRFLKTTYHIEPRPHNFEHTDPYSRIITRGKNELRLGSMYVTNP